jgi:hypothetical protein
MWWKGRMSIQKASEQFTRFFSRRYKMLREFCAEAAPAISSKTSSGSTAPVPVPPRGLPSSHGLTTDELELYYAKPGSAQYGC